MWRGLSPVWHIAGIAAMAWHKMKIDLHIPLSSHVLSTYRKLHAPWAVNGTQRGAVLDLQKVWNRFALQLLRSDRVSEPVALGITSAIQGEGKTTSSIGIATALALETMKKVVLVEADCTNPTLAADFEVDPSPGLTDYLSGGCALEATLRRTALDELVLLPMGDSPTEPTALVALGVSDKLRRELPRLLSVLKQQFAYVLLDLPPVLGKESTDEMVRHLDGTLLVVQAGVTPRASFRNAAALLEEKHLLGVIQLGAPSRIPRWLSNILWE